MKEDDENNEERSNFQNQKMKKKSSFLGKKKLKNLVKIKIWAPLTIFNFPPLFPKKRGKK